MPEKKPIEQGLIARVTGAWKALTGNGVVDNGQAWFGPLNPIEPVVPREMQESVQGRQFDFPVGYNARTRPRGDEAVSFEQMRALADNCDVLRLVIETRKDQIAKMKFKVKPKEDKKEPDQRCKDVEAFFCMPDGENTWSEWLRQLMEELLVTDAATIYPWLTNGGKPYRFELMDGATIKRVLDVRGRTPAPPMPAYQQILKGVPVVNYTSDELLYLPRNKRVHKVYGYSPVEQVIMTVNIAIRRAIHQLQYYTEGSKPDLLFQVPPDWNMTQIKEFNDWWNDNLSGNTAMRRRAQFVPNGVTPVNTKADALKDPYDEWLARVICYCFSVSPQPFVKEQNRATAGTQQEMALEEGLIPLMLWVKGGVDLLIWKYFGYTDLEFTWEEEESVDPAEQAKIDDLNVKNGTATINEIRAKRGDAPVPGGDVAMSLTASGYVPIEYVEPEPLPDPLAGAAALPNGAPNSNPQGTQQNPAKAAKTAAKGDKKDDSKQAADQTGEVRKVHSKKSVPVINRDSKDRVKVRNALAKGLRTIFQKQAKAIAASVVSKVAKADNVDDLLDDDSWAAWQEFNDLFGKQLVTAGEIGTQSAYAQLDLNDASTLELANQDAIEYAAERSAYLVGKRINKDGDIVENPNSDYRIDDATREMLRGDVTTAMEQGLSNDELADMLAENYAFSEERAMTIARTETAFADTNGNKAIYVNSGIVDSKKWIVGDGCCPECEELRDEVVGLDEEFSNGVDIPPAHPNCRCDFLPIVGELQQDDSEDASTDESSS